MFFLSPIRWALRIPSLLVSGAVIYVIVSGVQVVAAAMSNPPASALAPASAIVVLPGTASAGQPSADLTARLERALSLYDAHVARRIVIAGAPTSSSAEASSAIATAWLVRHRVPSAAIVPLPAANAPSALSTSVALFGKGAKVVVVTDAMDALWARGAGSSDGLEVEVSPAVDTNKVSFSDLGPLWREATGVALGRVIGYGRASWAFS